MHTMRIPLIASALCLVAFSTSCVENEDAFTGDDELRIINGQPASSSVDEYAATVALHQRQGDSVSISPFCTGTLISDEVVLTAAHCCDEAFNGPKVNPMEPEDIAIYFGDEPKVVGSTLNGDLYTLSEVSVHPSYNRSSLRNDICLLRLSTPNTASPTVPALPASIGLSNADAGTLLDHVGFGYADTAKTEFGKKLHAEVPLAGLGCVVNGCPSSGDATQFSYVQDGDPYFGPCNGDSGGPAFIERNGTTYVAGITSYGDAACLTYGVSTNVSAFEGYISDFVGSSPDPDPTPDCSSNGECNLACAEGEDPDCNGAATCDNDGVCEVGESCDGRYDTAACGDCPGKTKGKPSGQFCYVEGVCEGPGC